MQVLTLLLRGNTSYCRPDYHTDQCNPGWSNGSFPCFPQQKAELQAAFRENMATDKPKAPNALHHIGQK